MEYVKCNLCGANNYIPLQIETKIVSLKSPYQIVKCKSCRLVYLNPRPTQEEIKNTYKQSDYFSKYGMLEENYYLANYVKKRLLDLEKKELPSKKILDVGCGTGIFLNYAHNKGWDVYGVDISPWAKKHIKDKFSLEIFVGELKEANFPSNFFDVVHMSHSLEHMCNPFVVLKEAYRILKSKGVLIVEVPNEFNNLLYKVRLMMKKPAYYNVPSSHLFFFSPETFKKTIQKSGFKVIMFRSQSSEGAESKYVGGYLAKKIIFILEKLVNMGSIMEICATKK